MFCSSSRWFPWLIVSQACQRRPGKTPIVALGPQEGTVRWADPDSAKELGRARSSTSRSIAFPFRIPT